MFDVGFWEILLILVLALVVLGPERLPQAARTVGYWVGKARRYIEGVKSEVEKEFDSTELKRMLHNQEVQIKELQSKLTQPEDFINQSYRNMFDDKDDHGKEHPDSEDQHPAGPRYEILEEDDETVATDTGDSTEHNKTQSSDTKSEDDQTVTEAEKNRSEKTE